MKRRMLMLGLDGAGKTVILYRLQGLETLSTITTIGFNVEDVQFRNLDFQIWDLGGSLGIRPYWYCYYPDTDVLVYVVDSLDRDRICDSKEQLLKILEAEELKNSIVCILANKQDVEGAMSSNEMSEALGLDQYRNRKLEIFGVSGITGEGLDEALDWVAKAIQASE